MKKITGICGRIMSIHRSNYSCEGKPGRCKRPGFFISQPRQRLQALAAVNTQEKGGSYEIFTRCITDPLCGGTGIQKR